MSTDVLQSINSIVRLYTIFYLYNRSQTRNNTIELGHFVATEKNMIPPYPYASQELAVVSEQDNIIGSALPDIVYSRGLIHRFASVFRLMVTIDYYCKNELFTKEDTVVFFLNQSALK